MTIGAYAEKAMLDWAYGGATPTRPATWFVGLSSGTPSSVSGSELTGVSAYARQGITWGAAASPAGSASNAAACTFTFSTACTVKGIQIWDTNLSSNSGNMLWCGTLSASSVMVAGDTLSFAIGSIKITLS